MKICRIIFPLLLVLFIAQQSQAQLSVSLQEVASGFSNIVKVAHAGDERLFIVERSGRIKILDADKNTLATPFLDIDGRVVATGGQSEQGLLGLAFHPNYADNGFFFLHYTNNSGNSEIARFKVSDNDPNVADAASETAVMTISQPFGNHNGGEIAFGPDGHLYIGMGDGGSGNDPGNRAQNPQSLHGKMLRINVDQLPYTIPNDNPFINNTDFLPEIWSWGLRNPWRFSFDTETGDLWIADVGQWDREEIDFQPATSTGGENYGWRCREGEILNPNVNTAGCLPPADYVEPIWNYDHPAYGPCSITGGYVYRGCTYPDLYGYYIYADYCSGDIWGLLRDAQGEVTNELFLTVPTGGWSTFGEGVDGEVYVAGLNNGRLYQLTTANAVGAVTINEDLEVLSLENTYDTYQWYLDGMPIAGATEATYTATESGLYSVEVAFANISCTYTSAELMVILTNTANIDGLIDFRLQPNPFQESITLELTLEAAKPFELKVYSLDGKVVYEKPLGTAKQWVEKINLSELKSGVYLLQVSNGVEELMTKLVKE